MCGGPTRSYWVKCAVWLADPSCTIMMKRIVVWLPMFSTILDTVSEHSSVMRISSSNLQSKCLLMICNTPQYPISYQQHVRMVWIFAHFKASIYNFLSPIFEDHCWVMPAARFSACTIFSPKFDSQQWYRKSWRFTQPIKPTDNTTCSLGPRGQMEIQTTQPTLYLALNISREGIQFEPV